MQELASGSNSFSLREPGAGDRPYLRLIESMLPPQLGAMLEAIDRPQITTNRGPSQLHVEQVSGPEAFDSLSPSWQKLHDRLTPRTPFTSPLWNALWWKHYRSQRLSVRDQLFMHVVKNESNELIAVAPMMITERPSVGPLRIRAMQCFGTDNNVTEIRSLTCAPENQCGVLEALTHHFAGGNNSWDWTDWGVLREDTWAEDVETLGNIMSDRQVIDYQLFLPGTWEQFRSTRSRNIKESLRKCYNSLKRAELTAELHVVQGVDECASALQTFFRLHAERARAVDTVTHPDVFGHPRDRGFLEEYVQEMAKRGQLRIFQLRIAGEVVATRIGFLFGDELYLYYSGYDTKWAKFSVMTTLLAEVLKWAIDQKLGSVNLSTGADVSKLRWDPHPTNFRAAIQIAPRLRSRWAFGLYHRARQQPTLKKLLALIKR